MTPGACIVQAAAADQVAAVVMTTHARSGMRRAVLGSVADYVVAHSPSPTVLTRGDAIRPTKLAHGPGNDRRDLCGAAAYGRRACSGSRCSRRAAACRGARGPVDLAMAQRASPGRTAAGVGAREQLDDVASRSTRRGHPAETHVGIGSAVAVIDAFAERVDADLIVMASHATDGRTARRPGSVTDAVMRTARSPVMVCRLVPPPPREPDPLELAHAIHHSPPPLMPQTIPEPADGIRHRTPSAPWKHQSGLT